MNAPVDNRGFASPQRSNLLLLAAAEAIVTARRGPKPEALPQGLAFQRYQGQREADQMLARFERDDLRASWRREVKAVFAELQAEHSLAPVVRVSKTAVFA